MLTFADVVYDEDDDNDSLWGNKKNENIFFNMLMIGDILIFLL